MKPKTLLLVLTVFLTAGMRSQELKPLLLPPEQVFKVYTGLKTGEQYKLWYEQALKGSEALNSIIQTQNEEMKRLSMKLADNEAKREKLQIEKDEAVRDQERKKPIAILKHPVTWFVLGVAAGIYGATR